MPTVEIKNPYPIPTKKERLLQLELTGDPRRKYINPKPSTKFGYSKKLQLWERRMSRIVGGIDNTTKLPFFMPAQEVPSFEVKPSDLIHEPVGKASELFGPDFALAIPSLSTARKRGATQAFVDVEKIYRERGGIGLRPRKTSGFRSPYEAKKIEDLRRKRDKE